MKKIILVLLFIFYNYLFATDVSNSDIKGIKLGMNVTDALHILKNSCNRLNLAVNEDYSKAKDKYGLIYTYTYHCMGKVNNSRGVTIGFQAGYDRKVFQVDYSFNINYLLTQDEIDLIVKKANRKYGNPAFLVKQKSIAKKGGQIWKACWGEYKKKYVDNEFWRGVDISCSSDSYLAYEINSNPYGDHDYAIVHFVLYSKKLYENQKSKYSNDRKKVRRKEIENIDI